jgi:hypothetical protein
MRCTIASRTPSPSARASNPKITNPPPQIHFPPHTQDFTHFADREPINFSKSPIGKNVPSKNARSIDSNQIVKIFF